MSGSEFSDSLMNTKLSRSMYWFVFFDEFGFYKIQNNNSFTKIFMKRLFLIMALLIVAAGCNMGTKVTGKVTFEDGSPLQKGSIMFDNGINSYWGVIQPDGSYAVGQTKDSQRIPKSKYKVWFSGTVRIEPVYNQKGEATSADISFPLLLPEFSSYDHTILEADVHTAGKMAFDFVVKRHPDWNKQQPYKPKSLINNETILFLKKGIKNIESKHTRIITI
jgi:hypothetical protein